MRKSYFLTIVGAILFPVIILWPFSIHSSNGLYATLGNQLPVSGCVAGVSNHGVWNISKFNQCVGWEAPPSVKAIGLISALFVAACALLVISGNLKGKMRARNRFDQINLLVALLSATATLIVYYLMRDYSQAHLVAANLAPPDLATGKLIPVHQTALGYGLTPFYVVIITALYLLSPLLIWYRRFSPKYVGGVKKKELFQ
ncbi:MAG TPA: hypothetical protein VFW90_00945 [Candidatus Saccharimonadales bacterium]|nr:hypothetical protein [Candidatus Saccharimonadales bacterium]